MKSLVFVDSDGTLKNNDGIISDHTIEVLSKLKDNNIEVVITTGRPRYHALKVKNNSNASRYVISSNGAEIYDELEDEVIYAKYLDNKTILKIYKIASKNNSICAFTIDNYEFVSDEVKNEHQRMLDKPLMKFLKENHVKQIFIKSDTKEHANKIYKKIGKLNSCKIANESPYFQTGVVEKKGIWFSVTHKDVNKGNAIKELTSHLNIELDNTYGFGNDYNDIEMFKTVGHSIIMDNANEDLKKLAKIVTKSNDEDGVAHLLEKLFLKKRKEK